jgi:CDP-4-dehydro-6-deoxyglucose reductase, E1
MQYKWPLSLPQSTIWDKLSFAKFILTNDRWTHGDVVQDFESSMAKFIGVKHAIFTSSGSTANTLIAMYLNDIVSAKRDIIVLPSTTWITSVSPFIREGFETHFIDISLSDFSMDLNKLEEFLSKHADRVACIFITSLIGFTPNIPRLEQIKNKYKVKIMMDNCENTLGKCMSRNVSSFFTSTTSTYFGHQIQSVEGGFVFTNSVHEYEYFMMARNHGMIRHLDDFSSKKYRNPNVDERFDFCLLGNNFRNSNLHAFLGLKDLQRAQKYFSLRRELYSIFYTNMEDVLILPDCSDPLFQHAPFCLPIIVSEGFKKYKEPFKLACEQYGIETRPIISGNLLRQTCLLKPNFSTFANSEYLHKNGFYVGLHGSSTKEDIDTLCSLLTAVMLNE